MTRAMKNTLSALACVLLFLPTVLFAAGALPYRAYVVHTGSMSPTIPVNSVVIVQKGVFRVGQVITFNTSNGVVTHRLIERRPDGSLVTKGDANRTPDPGLLQRPNVIGGVIAAPPLIGYVLVYMKNPIGLASALLAIVVVWLAFSIAASYLGSRGLARD